LGLVPFPRSPSRVRLCAVKYSMSERGREERARRLEGRVKGKSKKISVVAICAKVGGVAHFLFLGLGSFSSFSLACALVCC
jgi:hypothetical protein